MQGTPRILVIDDDAEVQDLIRQVFNLAGYEMISAQSAKAGAAVLKQSPLPDCVVLDLMMPDISGLEILRQIRGKAQFDDLPVIILSALADPDTIRKGLELGADRYVTKPYMATSLPKAVQEILRTGRRKVSS